MELLGADGVALPRAHWSPLFLAAEQSLVIRSGLIGFFHDYLRKAVGRRYLADEAAARAAHLRLADYFDRRRDSPRAVEELPWQLAEGGSWQRLRDLLVDPAFFAKVWGSDTFGIHGQGSGHALRTYWARIEANSPLRLIDGCQELLDGPAGADPLAVWAIAALLRGAGHRLVAAEVVGRVAMYFGESDDAPRRSRALGDQAALLLEAGEVDEALPLLREQERICRQLGDKLGLQRALGNQAGALLKRGDVAGASPLLQEQERISRELADLDGVATSLMNQAIVLKQQGELDRALRLLEEAERLRRALGHQDGLATVLVNRAAILIRRGEPDQAMTILRQAEQLSREVNDPAALERALRGQASVLRERGDVDGALRLLVEAEEMCRRMPDRASVGRLQGLLATHASMLSDRHDYEGASRVFAEHAEVSRRLGDHPALATSLHVVALLKVGLGRSAEALPLVEEAYQTAVEHGLTDLLAKMDPLRQVLRRAV
jgi:tetratricopeptide (TPR) repeat protein